MRRNIDLFPDDFMFELSPLEIEQVASQMLYLLNNIPGDQ
jgi:hypothetical protein